MVQTWRKQAGSLLITFMVLDVLSVVYTRTAGASLNTGEPIARQLMWIALDSLLVWRIWRHGRLAWIVLLVLRVAFVLLVVMAAVWPWSWYLWGAIVGVAAQATLLVSPAIRHHLRAKSYGS